MGLSDIRGILIALAIVIILFAAGMVGHHYALVRAFNTGPARCWHCADVTDLATTTYAKLRNWR